VADGIESLSRTRKHSLIIANRQHDLIHLLDELFISYIYMAVKISIQSILK